MEVMFSYKNFIFQLSLNNLKPLAYTSSNGKLFYRLSTLVKKDYL